MSIKIKNGVYPLEIIKEGLLSEKYFIEYCRFDHNHGVKIENINEGFLSAAESDSFIVPLLQITEKISENGSEKEVKVNYYSPHQIFIIAALSKNQVYDGKLWANDDLEFYKQQGFRMVNWGISGYAFNINVAKGKGKTLQDINIFDFCRHLHDFLRLLHSLHQKKDNYGTKLRHYARAPILEFDMSNLDLKILTEFNLSIPRIKLLRHQIAALALQIDPLETWYPYIQKHPRWRRDFLKGDAQLAQEIYDLYELLTDVQVKIDGKKAESIFELVYFKYRDQFLTPLAQYVDGTDVKSLKKTIEEFRSWSKEGHNNNFIDDVFLKELQSFEIQLKEFEDKYTARYIPSGIRNVETEEVIKAEDLDPKTKQYFDQIIQQATRELQENKTSFLSLWDDEIKDRIKKGEITLEQAKKEDFELFIKTEIFSAIETRLTELKRQLWGILNLVQIKIASKVNDTWEIEHNFSNHFWFTRKDALSKLTREDQLKLYDIEYKKAYKTANDWSKKRDVFGKIMSIMDLLFCSVCREKPVLNFQSQWDEKFSGNIICDECLAKLETEDRIASKDAEVKCEYCERILFKFGYKNIISNIQASGAIMNLRLEYGRLEITAKCNKCKEWNKKILDWGWVD